MPTTHTPTSRQNLFSAKFIAKAPTAAATAIPAPGFLAVPTPAQARPMLPLGPPACSQYNFYTGDWPIANYGEADLVIQTHHGPTAAGRVLNNGTYVGSVTSGGIYDGRNVDFTITSAN